MKSYIYFHSTPPVIDDVFDKEKTVILDIYVCDNSCDFSIQNGRLSSE